jgi:prolyl-tRNA editing enzyme YbaK/EbsC (Cys-tRNA(Pro) deacylase)
MNELSQSAQRVQAALKEVGLDSQVVELPNSTRTAVEAAQAVNCQVGQIVKSLIFRGGETNRPILVIASGANRVDEIRLAELANEPVKKADADFVYRSTGYAIGGVPPVGLSGPILTFMDEDLLQYATVWSAAGTPHAVFELNPADLVRITGSTVTRIK